MSSGWIGWPRHVTAAYPGLGSSALEAVRIGGMPNLPPDPMPMYREARTQVDRHLREVEQAVNRDQVGQRAPLLSAWSARESTHGLQTALHTLGVQITGATVELLAAEHRLTATIADFTIKADQGTNRLARWTMVLAIVTGLLAIGALGEAWLTWNAPAETPQAITALPPNP